MPTLTEKQVANQQAMQARQVANLNNRLQVVNAVTQRLSAVAGARQQVADAIKGRTASITAARQTQLSLDSGMTPNTSFVGPVAPSATTAATGSTLTGGTVTGPAAVDTSGGGSVYSALPGTVQGPVSTSQQSVTASATSANKYLIIGGVVLVAGVVVFMVIHRKK